MTNFNIKQQNFTKDDVPTRLHHLATNLSEIKSLFISNSHQESVLELVKESRYFIEWVVPDMVPIDVEQAAEIVDLQRVLTRWLSSWEKIWYDATEKTKAIQQTEEWLLRVLEISQMQSHSIIA
ncbi:unknown protein [Rivularia sp. IAM M-261]|nr:unknown protein [Rivularia sp. IAM M-261]